MDKNPLALIKYEDKRQPLSLYVRWSPTYAPITPVLFLSNQDHEHATKLDTSGKHMFTYIEVNLDGSFTAHRVSQHLFGLFLSG